MLNPRNLCGNVLMKIIFVSIYEKDFNCSVMDNLCVIMKGYLCINFPLERKPGLNIQYQFLKAKCRLDNTNKLKYMYSCMRLPKKR